MTGQDGGRPGARGRRVAMAVLGLEIAGRYRLDERLGAGGMSTVYRALDNVLERQVAVKLLAEHLSEDDGFLARFRQGGAFGRKADPPQRGPGVRLRTRPGGAPPLHRDGVRRRADASRSSCGSAIGCRSRRPWTSPSQSCAGARVRTPARRDPPGREAGKPDPEPGRRREAGRLRDRKGGRGLAHHADRLGASAPPPTSPPSGRRARRPRPAPTSTRWAWFCTSCWPGGCPTRPAR